MRKIVCVFLLMFGIFNLFATEEKSKTKDGFPIIKGYEKSSNIGSHYVACCDKENNEVFIFFLDMKESSKLFEWMKNKEIKSMIDCWKMIPSRKASEEYFTIYYIDTNSDGWLLWCLMFL